MTRYPVLFDHASHHVKFEHQAPGGYAENREECGHGYVCEGRVGRHLDRCPLGCSSNARSVAPEDK